MTWDARILLLGSLDGFQIGGRLVRYVVKHYERLPGWVEAEGFEDIDAENTAEERKPQAIAKTSVNRDPLSRLRLARDAGNRMKSVAQSRKLTWYGDRCGTFDAHCPAIRNFGGAMPVAQIHAFRKCSICGLPSDSTPHDSPRECLRAIDLEVRQLTRRVHSLTRQRVRILADWLKDMKISTLTESDDQRAVQEGERLAGQRQKIVAGARRQ
jgi:hypothetical protein